MEEELEKIMNETTNKETLEKVNDHLYLTKYQLDVLNRFSIPIQDIKDVRELLYYLSDIASEEEYDELEEVAREISDYYYYHEMRKWVFVAKLTIFPYNLNMRW